MSKSKVKNKIELKSNLIEIVVDATETEFEVQLQSDDAGTHFMIYLPESGREKFNIKHPKITCNYHNIWLGFPALNYS